MTLYMVIYQYYEDWHIFGIFSTKEKAQNKLEEVNKDSWYRNKVDIEEYELDK